MRNNINRLKQAKKSPSKVDANRNCQSDTQSSYYPKSKIGLQLQDIITPESNNSVNSIVFKFLQGSDVARLAASSKSFNKATKSYWVNLIKKDFPKISAPQRTFHLLSKLKEKHVIEFFHNISLRNFYAINIQFSTFGYEFELVNESHRGIRALNEVVFEGWIEGVQLLLENGANPDLTNEDGSTALHIASAYAGLDIVKLLMAYDANLDLVNKDKSSALHIAVENGALDIVKLLVAVVAPTKTGPH